MRKDDCGRWRKYEYGDFYCIHPIAGVYAIYFDGVLSYIGESTNLRARICNHKIKAGYSSSLQWGNRYNVGRDCFIKISYSRRYGDWAMRELRLIRRLQPQFNVVGRRAA